MLRVGADLGNEVLPFIATKSANKVAELDELPGWVGDISQDTDTYGMLGLGYARPVRALTSKRNYAGARRRKGTRWQGVVRGTTVVLEPVLSALRYIRQEGGVK